MSTLKIGWSEISVTPDKKVSLAGQFAERISEYVEKPCTATAMALESGSQQAVIVSADLVAISWNLVVAVREALTDNCCGLNPENVIIAAIHTHTAPGYTRRNRSYAYEQKLGTSGSAGNSFGPRIMLEAMLPPGRKYVEAANVSSNPDICAGDECLEFLTKQLAKVTLDAWNARAEGSFTNAFGRAAVGMCRRAVYNDGSAQMWGDTNTAVFTELEGGNDSGIELLFVYDGNRKLTGIVANTACPAQCVQHRMFVSPDFWGEVKVRLRSRFGEDLFLLALCSPAGDQCPVDLIRWVVPESDVHDPNIEHAHPLYRKADPSMFDLAGMKKAGKRIATEIIDAYEEGLDDPQEDPVFIHRVETMKLPVRRTTLSEYHNAQEKIRSYLREKEGDLDYNDAAKLQVHLGILTRFRLQDEMNVLDTEVHIMRLGNIAIATNPFELFLDYGNQIRVRSRAAQTILIQLANGSEGYLPTLKAEQGGHYSAFISSGTVGHVGGDQLVRETLEGINKLFD